MSAVLAGKFDNPFHITILVHLNILPVIQMNLSYLKMKKNYLSILHTLHSVNVYHSLEH